MLYPVFWPRLLFDRGGQSYPALELDKQLHLAEFKVYGYNSGTLGRIAQLVRALR
jgi:hypothetical protein